MDVLKPQLVWIGSRCYRINNCFFNVNQNRNEELNDVAGYQEKSLYDDDETDEFLIFEHNKYLKTAFHVPSVFFSQIIGTKGLTKKRIEAETKTQIYVPKQGVQGDIAITGESRQSIISAVRKINSIVLGARNRHQFTHFISVPLNNKEIVTAYKIFKEKVMALNYPCTLFQDPFKLHITIGTLTLMDNEDRALAGQILNELLADIRPIFEQNSRSIELKLLGLEIMNDDPSAVDVLYGIIQNDAFQKIADIVFDKFVSKGLAQKKLEHIKLHCTLLNSLFNEKGNQQRKTFDARKILEDYSNYSFGSQKFTEIHLSQRYSTSIDGFYEATGILKL